MTIRIKRLAFALLLAGLSARSDADLWYEWPGGTQAIPDDDASGLAYKFNISAPETRITSVSVTLSVAGGWNGDLYAYLSNASGFAVLLNRVGAGASNPLGYADAGMNVTLTSGSGNDIHNYQTYNSGGQPTGTWQADGRFIDPLSEGAAFDSAARNNKLDVFNGKNPNGEWTFFIADRNGGDIAALTGWRVAFEAVPEPDSLALLLVGALLFAARRRVKPGIV